MSLGNISSCATILLMWFNRDDESLVDHYEIFRGGSKVADLPAGSTSYTDRVGCNFAAVYTITQVMKNGPSCSTESLGVPHSKNCDVCIGNNQLLNLVTSASYKTPVMPGSIATIFANQGKPFTSTTISATSLPLPVNLAGTQVLIDGIEAGLFYVSPNQINFLMPQTRTGTVDILVTGSGGERTQGVGLTGPNPGIFTADRSGAGVAAALVTTDGQSYQPIFDDSGRPVPVSVVDGGQPNFLILFGTGIRNQGEVEVKIADRSCPVVFSGPHPTMPGLDQINVRLPESIRGSGMTHISVFAGGFAANLTQISIGN